MMNKIIKYFARVIFIIFIALLISTVYKSSVYAADTIGAFYAQNSGTYWGLWARYYSGVYGTQSLPSSFYLDISNSSGVIPNIPTNSRFRQWDLPFSYTSGDRVQWKTACADPLIDVAATFNSYAEGDVYNYAVNATCPSSNSVGGQPASCSSVTNRGYVSASGWCPSGPYCIYAGNVYTAATAYCPGAFYQTQIVGTSPDSCGYGGTCNYYYCTLRNGGGYCNLQSNSASCGASCGGGSTPTPTPGGGSCTSTAISGTNMCGGYSYTCADTISTSLSTSCSGTTPVINATWTTPANSNNVYDLYVPPSGGSVCGVNGNSYTISSGLSDNTSYTVGVRSHTTGSNPGPTVFGYASITTPNCACATPAAPTNLSPSGTIDAGTRNITWNPVSGVTQYLLRIDDTGSGGDPCTNPGTGDVCTGTITSTSYSYNFLAGHNYNIWVHSQASCGAVSGATSVTVNVTSTYTISGNVWDDNDNNGIRSVPPPDSDPDTNHSGVTLTLSGAASRTTTTNQNGNYSFTGLLAGSYTVTVTAPSGFTAPVSSQNKTLGPNATANFMLIPSTTITAHVYNDFNGNGAEDASDTPSSGRTVTVTGQGAGTYTTNTSGNVSLSNLSSGNSTITVSVPSGWTSTTTNPRTITVPPGQTANFGIRPPAPTCTSLTANPTTVAPGGSSTLTCQNPTSPSGDTLTYTFSPDSTIAGDSVNPTTTTNNTSTWTAPDPYWTQDVANPSVSVCNPGGICNNYQTAITIVPQFSIAGSIFVDENKDGIKDPPPPPTDRNYNDSASTIQIRTGSCGGPLVQTISSPNGNYSTGANLAGGTYVVCYTSLPLGYQMTNPLNGPPASFSVTIGNASTGGSCAPASYCDANGNITNLNFGISNSIPWIQTTGGDSYSNGLSNPIPPGATCGTYVSLVGGGGAPGVVYVGNGTADFGAGQASQNPYNWLVGGLTYPEVYTPKGSELKTSYNTMYQTALRSGITPTPLGNSQCGPGGIGDCSLAANLSNGVYVANGNLTLTGASYTFAANRDIVILVNGDLNINTEIHVPTNSTAIFTSSRDINVASSVGEATITSIRANVEGYYSADRNFNILGLNSCPTSDRRLNVAGSVVVNAALNGGSLVNQRDLCSGNLQCPVFMVIERPDFILNSPEFIKAARRIWQEVAP